jgi:hypothetical protein
MHIETNAAILAAGISYSMLRSNLASTRKCGLFCVTACALLTRHASAIQAEGNGAFPTEY